MADYYVSALRGSDSTGTGTATNPWKTIGKPIGTSPAITLPGSGTTRVYFEPGSPYREQDVLALTPSSSAPLELIGDCDGTGFLAGGYTTPVVGPVEWRGWTDEFTPMSGATFSFNNSPYVTLRGLKIYGGTFGNGGCLSVTGASNNLTIEDCDFIGYVTSAACQIAMPFSAGAWNLTIQRCKFIFGTNAGLNLRPQANASDFDINTIVRNCQFIGRGDGFYINNSGGTGTGLAKGVTVQNCTAAWCNNGFRIYSTVSSAPGTAPVTLKNCRTIFCVTGVLSNNSSQASLDYNAHHSSTDVSGPTAGSHSKSLVCPAVDFGDARWTGLPYRPFLEPSPVSAYGGFGTSGTPPTVDLSNRPRPAGYGSLSVSCGELERHDTARKETTTTDAGGVAAAIDGPGDQIFEVAVNAVSTTIAVKVRYDTNHGATNKPDVKLLACPEIGVAAQTQTMTAAADTWETLTFSAFTPTAKGRVKLQFVPHPAAANGIMFMDTLTIT